MLRLCFRVALAFDTIFNTELGKYVSKCRVRFRTEDEAVNPDVSRWEARRKLLKEKRRTILLID